MPNRLGYSIPLTKFIVLEKQLSAVKFHSNRKSKFGAEISMPQLRNDGICSGRPETRVVQGIIYSPIHATPISF